MTTEPIQTLAPGESADDLVAELDALLASIQRREISLNAFVAEVRRIDALVEARLGVQPEDAEEPALRVPIDHESSPEEDAYDIWCSVRAAAVNRYVSWEEVERELEAELSGTGLGAGHGEIPEASAGMAGGRSTPAPAAADTLEVAATTGPVAGMRREVRGAGFSEIEARAQRRRPAGDRHV